VFGHYRLNPTFNANERAGRNHRHDRGEASPMSFAGSCKRYPSTFSALPPSTARPFLRARTEPRGMPVRNVSIGVAVHTAGTLGFID
jgi:hypothetical protein